MGLWRLLALAGVGLTAGFFSGLFGVGGGIVLVPLLILVAGYTQRMASGTSLAAVLPTALAGAASYASTGSIDWISGILLAGGAVAGSLLGTWLLDRIPAGLLRWLFVIFLVAVAVRLFFAVPDRGASLTLDPPTIVALLALGTVVGTFSGLLGVGGGVIIVPALVLLFGTSDLIAKGTSLLVIVPTAVTGTIANTIRRNVDLRAAFVVGLLAIPASVGGVAVAVHLPPALGSTLFALLLLFSAAQLAWNAWRKRGTPELPRA